MESKLDIGEPMSAREDWTRSALTAQGFVGWTPWSAGPGAFAKIDATSGGVYVIFRTESSKPTFLLTSPAGRFRGDPSVDADTLQKNWVPAAHVVYIGKANHGRLRRRLREFEDFGVGGKRRHSGGRLIWQLADSAELLVAWKVLSPEVGPRAEEVDLIAAFKDAYGKRPFANDPQRLGQ